MYGRGWVSDDLVLYDRWRSGDNAAGQELLRRHFDSVYAFFETKCEAEADELTQATFLACLKSRDNFRRQSSFRTFLFSIARHELFHLLRRRERHDKKLDFAVTSIAELITTPGSRIARQQEHALLVEALTQGLAGYGRADGETGWGASVLVLAFAPSRFAGEDAFLRQTTWLADAARGSRPADPAKPVRMPGQLALARKREAEANGVPLAPVITDGLGRLAEKYGVALPPPVA